jgi:hypothetical protein
MAVESKSKNNVVIFEKKKRTPIAKKKVALTESQIQSSFFMWLAMALPFVRQLTWASANGGLRNIVSAVNLKRQGVLKGVLDVHCAIPSSGKNGLFIEFKAGKGKVSPEQDQMINLLRKNNHRVEVCWDWEVAKDIMIDYLKGSEYEL